MYVQAIYSIIYKHKKLKGSMMKKQHSVKNKTFIIEFPLKTQIWQEHILARRFEVGRKIYNALLAMMLKQVKEMKRTKVYRGLISSLTTNKANNKEVWKEINALRIQYKLSEYGFSNKVTPMKQHFKGALDIHTVQKISLAVWKAFEACFFRNGKKVHFKKYNAMRSLESKTNAAGIRFKQGNIEWLKLKMPVIIDKNNVYECEAIENCSIKYNRIIRKYVGHKYRYYVQIVFAGNPSAKRNKQTGEFTHQIGSGDVGLDIGPSTIAISSQLEVKILELANKARLSENKIKLLQRKMGRSRRATNPDNYNEDGTINKGKKKWICSHNYIKVAEKLKEQYRKLTAIRKYQHEVLANFIISLGDKIYVEEMNFQGLAKRAKFSEDNKLNKKGKHKRKKRFGKSIGNRAPAMLLEIINRKLGYFDKQLVKINTREARASQFNHVEQAYKKKKLSQRWNYFGEYKVQRDMYSAFLIMNINPDLKTFDLDKCNERFEHFYELHNQEVNRLQGNKNLSSIAI